MSRSTSVRVGRADAQDARGAPAAVAAARHRSAFDHGRAPPMNPIPRIERGFAALAALRFDHRMGKFALAHFQNGGAGRGLKCRPRGQAKGKAKSVRHAGDRGNAGHADIRRDVEQPAASRRSTLPQLRQQSLGRDLRLVPRRDRFATVAALPPKAGGVPLDQFEQSVQGRRVPGRCLRPIRCSAETAA